MSAALFNTHTLFRHFYSMTHQVDIGSTINFLQHSPQQAAHCQLHQVSMYACGALCKWQGLH